MRLATAVRALDYADLPVEDGAELVGGVALASRDDDKPHRVAGVVAGVVQQTVQKLA